MNANIISALRITLLSILLVCAAAAQTLTLDQTSLTHGGTVNVTFKDASKAGQKVVIEIVSGGVFPKRDVLSITLDGNGVGVSKWVVPAWDAASFHGPGAPAVSVACNP